MKIKLLTNDIAYAFNGYMNVRYQRDILVDIYIIKSRAMEASERMKEFIRKEDYQPLINYTSQGTAFNLAIPTPEHYLQMLYA